MVNNRSVDILLVEDNWGDVTLITQALAETVLTLIEGRFKSAIS